MDPPSVNMLSSSLNICQALGSTVGIGYRTTDGDLS